LIKKEQQSFQGPAEFPGTSGMPVTRTKGFRKATNKKKQAFHTKKPGTENGMTQKLGAKVFLSVEREENSENTVFYVNHMFIL
jgi:hypothetical protein